MGPPKISSGEQDLEQTTSSAGSGIFNKLKTKFRRSRKVENSTASRPSHTEERLIPTAAVKSTLGLSGVSGDNDNSQQNIRISGSTSGENSGAQLDIHNSIVGSKVKGVLNPPQGLLTSTSASGVSPSNLPKIPVEYVTRILASSANEMDIPNDTVMYNSDPKTLNPPKNPNTSKGSVGTRGAGAARVDTSQTNVPPPTSPLLPLAWQDILNKLPLEEQNILRKDLEALITVHFAQVPGVGGSGNVQNIQDAQITSAVLTALFRAAEGKRRECEEKKWKIRIPGGKEVVLRAVVEKIVDFANRFREIGTVAVQYNPTGAALPWAGFVLILQFVTADIELLGTILSGLEEVARVIADGAFYEKLYLSDERIRNLLSPTTLDRLRTMLTDEYSAIISYLITAISICRTNSLKKTAKGQWYLSKLQSDFNSVGGAESNLRKHIGLVESELRKLTDEDATKHLKEFRSELSTILHRRFFRQDEQIHKMLQYLDTEERARILVWLSDIDYTNHHAHIRKNRLPNTGDWFQKHEEFVKWQDATGSSCLWLIGGAGTGKSTLVSHVIDTLMTDVARSDSSEAFAYFYCNRDDPQRRKPEVIMSSLVKQLACLNSGEDLQKIIIEEYRTRQRKTGTPSPLNLIDGSELARKLCDIYPQSVIIVDALDECDPEIRHELLLELYRLGENSSSLVKILITSRPDDDLTTFMNSRAIPTVILDASKRGSDIENIARGKVEEAITKRGLLRNTLGSDDPVELKRQMVEIILEGAQGMPLWITHQLNYICLNTRTLRTIKQVLDALRAFPKGLKGTYDYILQDILNDPEEKFNALAIRAFQWVMTAVRPLAPDELLGMLDTGLEEQNIQDLTHILDICHNMLVFDQVESVIRFYHLSVRDYLETQWPRLFTPVESVRELVIEQPLLLLGQVDAWDNQEQFYFSNTMDCSLPRIRSLLTYTSYYWPRHLSRNSVSIAAQQLLLRETSYEAYLEMVDITGMDSHGIELKDRPTFDFSVDMKVRSDAYYEDPLCVPVYWGLYEIFKLVIKQGVSVSDPKRLLAITLASLYRQIQGLRPGDLVADIDPFTRYLIEGDDDGSLRLGEIIAQAVLIGHVGLVKYLLEKSTDGAAKQVTPHLLAMTEKIRSRPRNFGQDWYNSYLQGPHHFNALLEAARFGYEDVVRFLVEEALIPTADGRAIRIAIIEGHEEIAIYLIENANTDEEDLKNVIKEGVFEQAVLQGYENIVSALVEKGFWNTGSLVQTLAQASESEQENVGRYLQRLVNSENRQEVIKEALDSSTSERILRLLGIDQEALPSEDSHESKTLHDSEDPPRPQLEG